MIDQLTKLRELNEELIKERKLFENMKSNFNEDVQRENEYAFVDPYQGAKSFYMFRKNEIDQIRALRKEHPRYGEKRIKNEMMKILSECYPEPIDTEFFPEVVNAYLIYDRCGFFDVFDKEKKIFYLEMLIMNAKEEFFGDVIDSSKETVSNIGNGAINILKPYGEVARGQFDEAAKMTKGLINKGSKKLVKLLKKLEDKTDE